MEARYPSKLVEHGKLRINSLNYYKDIETHGTAVGDREENTYNAVSVIKGTKSGAEFNALEKMIFGAGSSTVLSDFRIEVPVQGRPS